MKEQSWVIGAITFGSMLAIWLWLDYRKKHPRAERGDPFAAWDSPARPIRSPFREEPQRYTDRSGNPRLPSRAETTAELQKLADDYEKDHPFPPVRPARRNLEPAAATEASLPPAASIPFRAIEPTAVYAPAPKVKAGPEPHEWTWWAGRWWPPAALEESLDSSDWLRELLVAA